jgi:hypothetical protein
VAGIAVNPVLRITNDGGRMLKGEIALTKVLPTPPKP